MKRIILYGCGTASVEMRRNVEFFMDKSYEITGCIDGKYNYDALDNKPFFEFEELQNIDFDFILLCSKKESTLASMLKRIQESGIDAKKVLTPLLFMEKSKERAHIDLINIVNNYYSGEPNLIFGMSYSYTDLILKGLKVPFFRCCCPGMDLYYSLEVYKYMHNYKKISKKIDIVWLMFAYDHFHYDMSRSLTQYKSGNIFSLWRLDDWHNAEFCADAWEYIENYRLFGKRITEFYHFGQFDHQNKSQHYSIPDGESVLPSIWFRKHEETVVENIDIFKKFINLIREDGANPVVIIPPYYLHGIDKQSKEAFEEKRKEFYQILNDIEAETGRISLFDYSDLFEHRKECFTDLIHLNSLGAKLFTEIINREVILR